MYYKKLQCGNTVIEFKNNWLGEETVLVFGQVVSRKSSILGTNHYFNVTEDEKNTKYILTTKVDANLQIRIDLIRNGDLIHENVLIEVGKSPLEPAQDEKAKGLTKLHQYELDEALDHFRKAIEFNKTDAEVYFHMACAYSVQEKALEGFESLQNAVQHHLQNRDEILKHDMLAYLRMHQAFTDFSESGYKTFDRQLLRKKHD